MENWNKLKTLWFDKQECHRLVKDDILIFLDLETTGIPVKYNSKKFFYFENARVIEIAYCITNLKGKVLCSNSYLIKGNNITNSHVHGITNSMVLMNGINIITGLEELIKNINKYNVTTLVCHNINFDFNVLCSEFYRHNMLLNAKRFENLKQVCTMENAGYLLKLNKYIKLIDLYNSLFDEKKLQTHRAMDDVRMCMKCFFVLKNKYGNRQHNK